MKGSRPYTENEVSMLLDSFEGTYAPRNRALCALGIYTGFRISELLSLRLCDVVQHNRIVDRVTVDRAHMKKKIESRTVMLHQVAKRYLEEWIAELDGDPNTYLFKSRQGCNKPIGRRQALQVLHQVYEALGLTGRLGTHAMRKTFANKVYDKLGGDLVKTQRALGHRNINSTVSYLSFKEEDIDRAILDL